MQKKQTYQYTHPITGRRCRFRGTAAECEQQRKRIEDARRRLRNGEDPRSVASDFENAEALRLSEAWEEYLATRSPRARAKAAQYWRTTIDQPTGEGSRTLGGYRLAELDNRVIARWGVLLLQTGGRTGNGRASATVQLALDYTRAALRCVRVEPRWTWRPNRDTRQERPWCRSLAELERLLAVAAAEDRQYWARGHYAARWYCAAFAAFAGLRNAELAGLAWDAVNLDAANPTVVVRVQAPKGWKGVKPSAPPKGGRVHVQRLHPSAADMLRRQLAQLTERGWHRPDGPVWPTRDGQWSRCGRAIDSVAVRRWARQARLPRAEDWCAHSLRHTFCSFEVAAAGGDLASAARRTGHADLRALLIYVHALGDGLGDSPVPVPNLAELPAPTVAPSLPPAIEPARGTPEPEAELDRGASFKELARNWLATPADKRRGRNGAPIDRPVAVTRAIRRKGQAAYARQRRAANGQPREAWLPVARTARTNAERAVKAAWARALKAAKNPNG